MATCYITLPTIPIVVGNFLAIEPFRLASRLLIIFSFALFVILFVVATIFTRSYIYLVYHESLLKLSPTVL